MAFETEGERDQNRCSTGGELNAAYHVALHNV